MASSGAEGDDGGIPDDVHVLLQVEHEQMQKKAFIKWRNAHLAKSPDVSSPAASSATEGRKHSVSRNVERKSGTGAQPIAPQSFTAVHKPVMIHCEVPPKTQRMARSRLEKARLRLQRRIQQAGNLFGDREMTESQVKKKQKALKVLQPALLEEFLGAVEGFGAFCSGPQLQDLMLDSDSVRQQWEEVRREMAAFVHSLKSNIREGKQPFSVLQSEIFTNSLHEAADSSEQQQQAVTQEPSSVEGHFDSLKELRGSPTPRKSSSLAANQPTEDSLTGDTVLLPDGRGLQLKVNVPLSPTDTLAHEQLKQSTDRIQPDVPTVDETVPVHDNDNILQDVPAEDEDPLMQSEGCGWELRTHLLNMTEISLQAQTPIQAVVRSNTVESKQEAEWTVVPPQEEEPPEQEALARMTPLEKTADLMESEDDQKIIFTEKLTRIICQPLDISSLTVADSTMFSDLKEIEKSLKTEIRKHSEQSIEEERPEAASQSSVCQQLERLRLLLDEVQSAAQALDHFLDTLRDIRAQIPTLHANQDPGRQASGTNREEEKYSWQTAMQRLKPAMEQSDVVDSRLKAAGMTLTMDGATVTCQDVVKSVSKLVTASRKPREKGKGWGERQDSEVVNLTQETKTGNDSALRSGECSTPGVTEEESRLEAVHKTQMWRSEGDIVRKQDQIQRRRSSQAERKMDENECLVQRRADLLAALKEMKEAALQLGLQEPTLPALQHRTRVLTKLESRLAVLVSEVQFIRGASSQSGVLEENQTRDMQDLWEETTKSITKRLEQSCVLTELLKRFQSRCSELSGTLQRAESTISEQASYMGKDYLQRRHSRVEETKSKLNGLGGDVEEVRSISRQIHSLLRQIPGCTEALFEREADAVMDHWLDLLERTESRYENLHLCLTLWDGVLQLGTEVESWSNSKVEKFAQSPCFLSVDDIKALQNQIRIQEESVERFHRRAAEIQSLLQSTETPLELQVAETQMRQKMEQLKELVSESEDVHKQMETTKAQIVRRITEVLNSLQKIEDSLCALTAPDVPTVCAKLKELCRQLHSQDEQAQSLMEDVRVLASIASPAGLQSLSANGIQLEEKIRSTHQLFSEVEQQTERNIQDLHRLQTQKEHLEEWLRAAEDKALKRENLGCLREKPLQQSVRTDLITQLVSSLRSSNLQPAALLEQSCKLLERCHTFHTRIQGSSEEQQCSLNRDPRPTVDPTVVESSEIRTSVEHKLHCDQGLCSRLEEGLSNEEHFGQLLQDCHHNLTIVQEKMSVCQEEKDKPGGPSTDGAALEVLLEDVTDVEKDFLQLGTLRNSLAVRSTAEARASISERVGGLQNQERVIESSIKEHLPVAPLLGNPGVQRVREEASVLQTGLSVFAENVGILSETETDLRQLTLQGCTIQDCEKRMSELAVRVNDLQRTAEMQETPPADVILTVSTVCKDLNSLRSVFQQEQQECVENTPESVSGVIRRLQQWSQTVQTEPTSLSQPQIMEPERTAPDSPADLGAAEVTGGSFRLGFTMQDVWSDIQGLVERSNIMNRTPNPDLYWYLKSSPGEADIRLTRTVQHVLACRYQPAQLQVTAVAKQLKEAQECECCVQEQVAAMKNDAAIVSDPNLLRRAEKGWSAALLDASATVQVKTAQLDLVKKYHLQMKITKTFLEVLAAEKEKSSLNSLGGSGFRAGTLCALLQTIEQKKSLMDDLLSLSSQLSVHLSDAESSGGLLAYFEDLQEDWRLLKGSTRRAVQQELSCTSQSSLVLKEAKQLQDKLEDFLEFETDSLSSLELVCLTTDLKLYNQLYLSLRSQSDALVSFSLGQKEKDEIEQNLQELGSLFSISKKKLGAWTESCGSSSLNKISKPLRDLIVWAKQAEIHISTGQKLALFPEEARIQIAEMRKFQADILSRRRKMRLQVEEMKGEAANVENEDGEVLKTVEDLYETIADSLDQVLDSMKKSLRDREELLSEFASLDAWFAETHANRDPCRHIENVSNALINQLESELKTHRLATAEIEKQLKVLDALSESCTKICTELSPGESRYLVTRLSGLWTELDGLLAHENATSRELEQLIHERTSSDEELSTIQDDLKEISADLEQQKFPLTLETLTVIASLKHKLMEHLCQVQQLQHCHEDERNSLLFSIGKLQDRCKALRMNVFEQDKYLYLRGQMEESVNIAKRQIQDVENQAVNLDERFRLCHTLLVELPLMETQCSEAADQLETIAPELHPSELHSEKEQILRAVETLASWERSVTDDIKHLEAKFLPRLQFSSELPALTELLQKTKERLEGAKPVSPDGKAIDEVLQKYWVIRRNVESGMRMLEGLAERENVDMQNYKELYSLRDAAVQDCDSLMVGLSQARESIKDYQWAAQGALAFLHNAEETFSSAPGGFLDCTEEQKQTQQALKTFQEGFEAHIRQLVERVPQQRCISQSETELLHTSILSQVLARGAVLEAQAQLRLECLQRCEIRQQSYRQSREKMQQEISEFETRLSDLAAEQVTSYDECAAQQKRAKLLKEDLHRFIGKMEDLGVGCPMQGCSVGKDGELGALWRRWASLRRAVGLLMAHTEQKGEEWKDITRSLEQCCSHVASLQAEVPHSSSVSFTQEEPQELLAQAEMHRAGLEQEQQALLSMEHWLEHTLNLSAPHESISPGPIGKKLVKIQENIRSLKERNLLVLAAAQAEEQEREQIQQDIGEVEKHLFVILPELESCSDPSKTQELQQHLCSLKNKLKSITESLQSRYAETPADIGRHIEEVQQSLQKAEEMLLERNNPVRKLAGRVKDLGSGLERVKALLEQRSSTLGEAQNVLKHVWDELDVWHSSLMLLESEVQDVAEDHPDKAQVLMDQLTEPLQLYQNAAQMAEQRTVFLSKIPACLQEFEDIIHRAACWLAEAQTWLSTPCSFTTAKSLHSHATYLKLIQNDSERIGHTLQDFRSVLAEISTVCDVRTQKERLDQSDQEVHKMQSSITEPLDHLLQAATVVGHIEADLKTMEKSFTKIRTILSSMDITHVTLIEHLHNRQVILASLQSMRSSLQDIDGCKEEIHLPEGAEKLLGFSRAAQLLQQLEELEQVTKKQISQLENEREEEDGTAGNLSITLVSDLTEETQQLEGPEHRRFVQEAFEVSYSEEEEDEEDESCHSSSSDTLTCSIPEELEDEQNEDVAEMKPQAKVQDLDNVDHQFTLEAEMNSKDSATNLLSVKPEFHASGGSQNAETGLIKQDRKADVCQTFSPETVTDACLNTDTVAAAKRQFKAAASDLEDTLKQQTLNINTQIKSSLLEETLNTVTSFKKASGEQEEKHSSTVPLSDQNASNRLKEQQEVGVSLLGSQQPEEFVKAAISSAGREEDDVKSQRWAQLHSQILTKLSSLRNVLEEQRSMISAEDGGNHEEVPEEELSTESVSSVLQQICESIIVLRQMAVGSDCSHLGVNELYETVRRLLDCLNSLPDFLLTCGGVGQHPQLRLLQKQCVAARLGSLAELLGKVDSHIKPTLQREEPEAHSCLTSLQDSLHIIQLVLNSSHNQQVEDSGLQNQPQELCSNTLRLLDESETEQIFTNLKDELRLECVLSRHLRESHREKLELQNASRSLLWGASHLLEMGEECLIERRTGQAPNRSKLQAVLCRHKKLLQVLRCQLSFLQYLFQREPDALKGQEDEWKQLEVRAKARQQQALEQEVASEKRLQDWICWEDLCGRLGRVLDESEAYISGEEPEGDDDDDEEETVQRRLDAFGKTLLQLDEGRVVLGTLLDQKKLLQTEPWFSASVAQAGGALELRWKSAYRRTEQEIQRFKEIQDSRARFQTDFSLVSERLLGASKHLKTLADLADSSDLSQEGVQSSLVQLLDFSTEVETISGLRESVSKDAAELLHLREADCPKLRTQLAQMQASCSRMTSDFSRVQDRLQQCLTAAEPPLKLLSELEDWLNRTEAQMNQEREQIYKAKNAARFAEILQKYQVLRKSLASGQLLFDLMSQPGPQMTTADLQNLSSERTTFAEKLGTIRSQWLHLQKELETLVADVEHIRHTCAERERRLQKLHGWIEQQQKQLPRWERPTSQTMAHNALPEWEAAVGRVKEVSAALWELKTTRVHYGKEEKHPSDAAFSDRAECVSQACRDLSQQVEALRPALQQTVEEWTFFQGALGDITLFATRVRCALQRHQAPLFSLKQAEGYSDFLQELQVKVEAEEEQLWTAADKSYQRLVETLHQGAAQALGDKVEEERKRWKKTLREIKDEHEKTVTTFSLWKEYNRLSDSCSHHLQHLWAELSSFSPEKDPQDVVCSLKKLQAAADELQSSVGEVLEVSEHLIGQLEPLAAKLIQSETSRLTCDLLLLKQAVAGNDERLQMSLEQQKHFRTRLEVLEEQMQKLQTCDADSVKLPQQVLLELSDLVPSLVDIQEMTGFITLNDQERERVRSLSRKWRENITRASDRNRELNTELQSSQDFQEKCRKLNSIQEKLERDSVCRKPPSYSNLQEMLSVHQALQAEILVGHQLLQDLLCGAVEFMEEEPAEKRSELMMQTTRMKKSWLSSVGLAEQNWTLTKDQMQQWRLYHRGLKSLKKLFWTVDSLPPPTGQCLHTLHQLQGCMSLYQRVEDSVERLSPVFTQTSEVGEGLSETMMGSDCQSRLQSELQDVKQTWEQITEQLRTNKDLVVTAVQLWSQCQSSVTSLQSELNKVRKMLPGRPEDSEEPLKQEIELSLQRLDTGLQELVTMKTDLSQYVASGDWALLEQQLEQLHVQWEELCVKVSLHRQEIADRLNAWTIFNDKNKDFCDWLTQMERKVCQSGDLSIEEMVEKLKKDCMEEINLFSENKSHLKQLGEQLLLARDEAKQSQVRGSLQEVNQRWHNLFHHVEARVRKLKETLVTLQQLDKNTSNLRSWLSRIEAELSRPITYSVCQEQEIHRRLAEHQELQRDIEQQTEGVSSVLSLCDVLLRDEDAAGRAAAESHSLQETSHSLDQRWRTICALALDRRLRIEETWTLWSKFLNDFSCFEDWLKMAERTAANPNSADVLFSVAKEELKKFESFQRQVHEQLTQLELLNNQYRRLARENRTDRAGQLKARVSEGNVRWDALQRRGAAILRRLKYFTSQREDFEGTRESMLVWLTELDLQLTNVEHFSESDVHHKIQQLNSFQKEIALNTERIDGLIVFGEALIQKSSPQDAALIEEELEELHLYCQEVFSRLVRFHQRLSQPRMVKEEPELLDLTVSLESSLELIGRPWLGRSLGSLPATPTHLLTSPLERSGRESPVSVDSLPLEWDHTGDVGGSSSHEDEEEEEEDEEEGAYFSALPVTSRSSSLHDRPRWTTAQDAEETEATPTLTSTPLKPAYRSLTSECSGSIEDVKRVALILDEEEQQEQFGLTGLNASDTQPGVIERWELLQAQSRCSQLVGPNEPDLDDITSWLESVIPELDRLLRSDPAVSIKDMEAKAKELKEMEREFSHYKSIMLTINLQNEEASELQEKRANVNKDWSKACSGLQRWDTSLRRKLLRCQEFHESLHSLLLWLAHAESRCYAVDVKHPETSVGALQRHSHTLTELQEELRGRQTRQASLQALWSLLQPGDAAEDREDAQEKLHVTSNKLKQLRKQVDRDLHALQQRLDSESAPAVQTRSSTQRETRESSPPRSFFCRLLRAALPLQLLLLLLLLLHCLIPLSDKDPGCTVTNNFARSFYPMLHYTNGPPPT